jgi:hypothetical protein
MKFTADEYNDLVNKVSYTTKTAEYFATVNNGKIALLGIASPEHELQDNQIILTSQEYKLLRSVSGQISDIKKLVKSVEGKIKTLKGGE